MLASKETAAALIERGATAFLAASEPVLTAMPRGNWIGGTIPYFMADEGGVIAEDRVFIAEFPASAALCAIRTYRSDELSTIATDAPDNGLTALIIPAGSAAHTAYAEHAPSYPDMFLKPIFGWISGVHLRDLGKISPKVIDGRTGELYADRAVALHATLPAGQVALIKIVNVFKQGSGDTLTFEHDGFTVEHCLVNGERRNFAEYLRDKRVDTRLPLVANYCGAMVNVSIQNVAPEQGKVTLYAPVFHGIEYRVAAPIDDYVARFAAELPRGAAPMFACNCILNFLYSELEGKSTGAITGPITFGEIAYQLLNQTLVYVEIEG